MKFMNYKMEKKWAKQWSEVILTNSHYVADPNVMLPGNELPRYIWCLLNRILLNHGRSNSMLHKWDPGISPACDRGCENETIQHIVNDCTVRKFVGGMSELFHATDRVIDWVKELDFLL